MKEITSKLRTQIESKIYQFFDIIDPTKTNSEHYKEKFSKMDNKQFGKFISLKFPYRVHVKPFEISPSFDNMKKAADFLNIPIMEKIHLPYLYKNSKGESVTTLECLVGYAPIKKVKQFITKKNAMSTSISERDMKTGLLVSDSKNGKTSDKEAESLAVMGLDKALMEFSKPKADSMSSKNLMYNIISTKGQVYQSELPLGSDESLAKNLINTYLIGCHINSNLINQDYLLPYTIQEKKKKVVRV